MTFGNAPNVTFAEAVSEKYSNATAFFTGIVTFCGGVVETPIVSVVPGAAALGLKAIVLEMPPVEGNAVEPLRDSGIETPAPA
ncbi:MAG: hypothetical protein JOZ38_07945 [Candidatus Eremiobacteraeota bacterium]|nr:hypothetical protein [Candidatus Eremiobacteraeota bacterium]